MKYEKVLEKIKNNNPFAFSRWGDGEFLNVNGVDGKNCDGNIYYKDLGLKLKLILSSKQDYYMGVQTLVEWSKIESKKYNQDWCDSDVFHRASMSGEIDKLSNVLNNVNVVYIGNKTHSKLNFINEFIEIPRNNVWLQKNLILNKIIRTFDETHKIYCFSAGMATNVFIDELWKLNNNNTYIDIGSVFDPYVGINSRSYHKKLNIIKL